MTLFFHASLISFSSNSRVSGMIVSTSSVQTTMTRSSRCETMRTKRGYVNIGELTINATRCSLSTLGSMLIESTIRMRSF